MQASNSKCDAVVYDGTKKGEHVTHSLGDVAFVKYPLTPATEQLVKEGDVWVIQHSPTP